MKLVTSLIEPLVGSLSTESVTRSFTEFTAEASLAPTAAAFTVPVGYDGILVYTGTRPITEARFNLHANIGGTVSTGRVYRWQGVPLFAPEGASVGFGASDPDFATLSDADLVAVPIQRPTSVTACTASTQTVSVDFCACPEDWTPEDYHLLLDQESSVITFPSDASNERWVMVKDVDDQNNYSPPRVYQIKKGQSLSVYCPFRRVALATPDGEHIGIKFDGSYVGEQRTQWYDFTALRVVNVSTWAELKAAWKAAIDGDDIVLANGIYTTDEAITSWGAPGSTNYSDRAYRIRAANPLSATIAMGSSRYLEIKREAIAGTLYIDGINFDLTGCTGATSSVDVCIVVRSGSVWIGNSVISGAPASGKATIGGTSVSQTNPMNVELNNLLVEDAVADAVQWFGKSGAPELNALSRIKHVNVNVVGCGATPSQHQCLTTHNGLDIECYGGSFDDLHGTNTNVIANAGTDITWLFMSKIRGNVAYSTSQYLCDTVSETQGTTWGTDAYLIGGNFEAEQTTASTPIVVDSADGSLQQVEGMVLVGHASATGRGINIQYATAEVCGVLVRPNSGHAVVVGFQNNSPERTAKIRNVSSDKGCIRYADNDYLVDARNCMTDQNVANDNFEADSAVSADITSKNNRSRVAFGPNWPSDASDLVADLDVDATTLMPASTETNLLNAGQNTAYDFDWGGMDAFGQILKLSTTYADVGGVTRQRIGISGQIVFPSCWI